MNTDTQNDSTNNQLKYSILRPLLSVLCPQQKIRQKIRSFFIVDDLNFF